MSSNPREIVYDKMLAHDAFSQWMNIKVVKVEPDVVVLAMKVRDEMTNGFSICHGGIIFSLADSALAFAANSAGQQAVSIEAQISFLSKVVTGDDITVSSQLIHKSASLARYDITIENQKGISVANFKGTVYFTGRRWE